MPLGYVLKQAGFKIGLEPSDTNQRAILLRFANEAAMELYEQADAEGCLLEQLFQVNGDEQIALPMYVGPLRAMREFSTHVPWHMYNMRPRYNQLNWKDRWRGWRLKGVAPLSDSIQNVAPLKVAVSTLETPVITVKVTGPTKDADLVSDTFVLDATCQQAILNPSTQESPTAGVNLYFKEGLVSFKDVASFTKDRVNNCNVYLFDVDNRLIATLSNNLLEARYRLVDVSLYPWSNTAVGPVDHYMEVLFKKTLPWFSNDEDEYPAQGFDNIWVNKMLQIWAEESGKGDVAAGYDAKATRSFARKNEDQRRGTEEEMALIENSHDTLLPRNRPMGPSRYMGQIYY